MAIKKARFFDVIDPKGVKFKKILITTEKRKKELEKEGFKFKEFVNKTKRKK